jgi:hypothetical protein
MGKPPKINASPTKQYLAPNTKKKFGVLIINEMGCDLYFFLLITHTPNNHKSCAFVMVAFKKKYTSC